jgi:signal transduction histidine kinase
MKRFLFFLLIPVLLSSLILLIELNEKKSRTIEWAVDRVSQNLLFKLESLSQEANVIKKDAKLSWASLNNIFYLLDSGEVMGWSRNDLAISPNELLQAEDLSVYTFSRSSLVVRRWNIGKGKILIGIIPLEIDHRINNQFIQPWNNPEIFPEGVHYSSLSDSSHQSVCVSGKCLFQVTIESVSASPTLFYLACLVCISITVLVILIVRHWHYKRKYFIAFLFLFGLLALLRIMMVELSFPSRWSKSDYYNPVYFASSSFNSSLADFFLNSLIVAISCGYLFFVHYRLSIHKRITDFSPGIKRIISVTALTFSFFAFLFPYLFVESIFHDSKIVFDLSENVTFDGLRLLAIAAVGLGCLGAFFIIHVLVRWAMSLCATRLQFLSSLFFAAAIFLVYSLFSEHSYWATITLGLIYFYLLFFTNYFSNIPSFGFRSFSYLLLPILLFSILIALANWHFSEERKTKAMTRFANSAIERDVLGEYLLNEMVQNISNDPFIQSSMSNPLLSKHFVRDKIREKYLKSYFDRYHCRIALFKTDGHPADDLTPNDLVSAVRSVDEDANRTPYKDIYFIRGSRSESVTRYLAVVNLSPASGFIILDLSLKRIIPKQSFPDLVVDNRFTQSFRINDFSFAFYDEKSLLSNFGNFNFEEVGSNLFVQSEGHSISAKGFLLISITDEIGRRIIVAAPRYSFFMVVANFSFFFVLGICALFLGLIAHLVYEYRKGLSVSYTTRIQSFAYLSFILPLVAVSFIALRMISQSNENQILESNIERGRTISEEISSLIGKSQGSVKDASIRNYTIEIAKASSLDLNLFDPAGNMIVSSGPELIDAGLVSNRINRQAWEKLIQGNENTCQLPGRIGALDYSSLFFPVRSDVTGSVVAILELPFIRSDALVIKSKVNVMANILVIFSGVFLLFMIVAIVSIDSFTWPFRLMAKTLKSTKIGGNEPMKWNSNDEIGLMVREYNQMVLNLDQSKKALEKSQRENAWKEIAQQVAHEIKNPLTPIKLTLQQMERALPDQMEPDKLERSVKLLLTQVDTLNEIATAFSSFAKMPSPQVKSVSLNSVLKEVMSLYKNQNNRTIKLVKEETCFVWADEKLLTGIFSNIILNAFQSKAPTDSVDVKIDFVLKERTCVISFSDNGGGIAEELKDRIFIPHFSTKQSGSGLGLAIVKQGVESMGGSIWFESQEGSGTAFFLELPLAT